MKRINSLFAIFAVSLFAALTGAAQTPDKPANPKFDAELAKKVGADKSGMRQYVLAILKTGPKDAEIKGDERAKLFKGHFDNIKRLSAEGKMAVAGPFGKNDKAFRGLFILAVPTVEEAKSLAETDPTVKAGVFVVEYVPWYGAAALMLSSELWEKTAKEM